MSDFITMVNRITTELRRSNLTAEAKNAVNDAIGHAASDRFYFNEMRGVVFTTIAGQEYYNDQGLVEIDVMWYSLSGGARYNMDLVSNADADDNASGSIYSGQVQSYSRQGGGVRLFPIPNAIVTIYADGFGKLLPNPLVNDADTNNWLSEGERYIRALAKAMLLKDVIRDYGEATVLEAIAEDHKLALLEKTTMRAATGTIRPTQF